MYNKKSKISVVSLLCVAGLGMMSIGTSLAKDVTKDLSNELTLQAFQLQPRLNVWGFSGDYTLGKAQVLIPIIGNSERVFYGLVEGNFSRHQRDKDWMIGGGLGYRQVIKDVIYGGYVLVDDTTSNNHNSFWIANPGLEVRGISWDIDVNGYLPVSNNKGVMREDWADNFGVYDYVKYSGHSEYDAKLMQVEEVGEGFDFEVGHELPAQFNQAKLYVGGYHFATENAGSLNGIKARLTYDINKYASLELKDSYDKVYHNKLLAGIKLSLGGYSSEEKNNFGIAARLLDPIEHDTAILNKLAVVKKSTHGSSSTLVNTETEQSGSNSIIQDADNYALLLPEHDNIWYFDTLATTPGDGSIEHPFNRFIPADYAIVYAHKDQGKIDKYPLMYFAPGYSYSFDGFSSRGIEKRFALPSGWGMYGMDKNYQKPASVNGRPSFDGGLDVNDGGLASTIISSIEIRNHVGGETLSASQDNAALYAKNSGNIILQNVDIENVNYQKSTNMFTGIYAEHSVLNFEKLDPTQGITDWGVAVNVQYVSGFGIFADKQTTINIDSQIQVSVQAEINSGNATAYGMSINDSTVNFNNGLNSIYVEASSNNGSARGIGIFINNSQQANSGFIPSLNFRGIANNINVTASGTAVVNSVGVMAIGSALNFNAKNNVILSRAEVNSTQTTGVYSIGIYANGSNIHFDGKNGIGSYIDLFKRNSSSNGIAVKSQKNDDINAEADAGFLPSGNYGLYADNKSSVIFGNGQQRDTAENSIMVGLTTHNVNTFLLDNNGIYADNSSAINFQSGKNTINACTISFAPYGAGRNYGVSTQNFSNINFNGGTNNIDATVSSASIDENVGIIANKSTILFNAGSNNTIKSTSDIIVTDVGVSHSAGVRAVGSTVIFFGGDNNISAASNWSGKTPVGVVAHGLDAVDGSVIKINNPAIKPNISATGNNTSIGDYFGIMMSKDSHLQYYDDPLTKDNWGKHINAKGNTCSIYWDGSAICWK